MKKVKSHAQHKKSLPGQIGEVSGNLVFFREFFECDDFRLFIPYIEIIKNKKPRYFIDGSILQYVQYSEYVHVHQNEEFRDIYYKLGNDPTFREVILCNFEITTITEYELEIFRYVDIWKDMIKVGLVHMKTRWKCLEEPEEIKIEKKETTAEIVQFNPEE